MRYQPKAYIFVGANASGKSTIISFLLEKGLIEGVYINADLILKEELGLEESTANYMQAFRVQAKKIQECIASKRDIVLEIVASKSVVHRLKEAGYYIIYIFVGTETPDINLLYLRRRVENGGHDVLVRKLLQRRLKSFDNLKEIVALELPNYIVLIDNSVIGESPQIVKCFDRNRVCFTNDNLDRKISWSDDIIKTNDSTQSAFEDDLKNVFIEMNEALKSIPLSKESLPALLKINLNKMGIGYKE